MQETRQDELQFHDQNPAWAGVILRDHGIPGSLLHQAVNKESTLADECQQNWGLSPQNGPTYGCFGPETVQSIFTPSV